MVTDELILNYFSQVAEALSEMFEPLLETVVLDYRNAKEPKIMAIYNNQITGRKAGQSTSDLGFLRLSKDVPDKMINVPNKGLMGQSLKTTSLAIRNPKNKIIGALGLHMDISYFEQMRKFIDKILETQATSVLSKAENFYYAAKADDLQNLLREILVRQGWIGRQLSRGEKEFVIRTFHERDVFSRKKAIPIVAKELKITRQTLYRYLKKFSTEEK